MIRIPRQHHGALLKVVDSHTYLGAKISFATFEQQTLHHRMQIGRITGIRLKKWLQSKSMLTTRDRIRLWQTCAQTSLCH